LAFEVVKKKNRSDLAIPHFVPNSLMANDKKGRRPGLAFLVGIDHWTVGKAGRDNPKSANRDICTVSPQDHAGHAAGARITSPTWAKTVPLRIKSAPKEARTPREFFKSEEGLL